MEHFNSKQQVKPRPVPNRQPPACHGREAMYKRPTCLCSLSSRIPRLRAHSLGCTSSGHQPTRLGSRSRPRQCRRYATEARNPESSSSTDGAPWWPTTPSFTPYDIFRLDRTAPYSKRRFYELVKLYHPDSPCNGHPACAGLSREVRLRRYRLIIAAHEILSDPVKRAAYDRDGTGWYSHPDYPGSPGPGGPRRPSRPPPRDDIIYANSTWEDWERYYTRHHPPHQQQVVSHRTFVTFLLLLTFLGGMAQASWISQSNASLERRVQEANARSARLLQRHRSETQQFRSSETRVQDFLMRRDPSGYGLKGEEEVVYQRVLDSRRRAAPETHLRAAN